MNDEKMSRRVFLAKSGKAVGLGLLAHFTLIGSLKANDSEGNVAEIRKTCGASVQNSCKISYTCSGSNSHSCASSFTCASEFTCNPVTSNNCNDNERNKCVPVASFKAE